jgi:cytochrome c oxidase assembly protein subunit 15
LPVSSDARDGPRSTETIPIEPEKTACPKMSERSNEPLYARPKGFIPSVHRVALLTAAATFPLIFMGGLVTSHKAGMSVPDWPNTYGYNMFTFPPNKWIGGIFYEHTHRLMGSVVGLLSIALVIWTWRKEPRRWVRWLSIAVLAAVIAQGVLGGLRVVLVKLDLAVIHGCFAQAFFCLTGLMCVVTSRWWHNPHTDLTIPNRRLFAACVAAVLLIYLQLVVGATMRHYDAGLAIPDVPLAYGQLLPPLTHDALEAANMHRRWELNLPAVTLNQVWLNFAHRVGAVLITAVLLALAGWMLTAYSRINWLRNFAIGLILLLVAQITLGVLTIVQRKPADIASAHVAVGALTLFTTFVLCVRVARISCGAATRSRASDPLDQRAPTSDNLVPV